MDAQQSIVTEITMQTEHALRLLSKQHIYQAKAIEDRVRLLLQAFLMRKLKIGGSMGMALKLQPILDAAAPKSKM